VLPVTQIPDVLQQLADLAAQFEALKGENKDFKHENQEIREKLQVQGEQLKVQGEDHINLRRELEEERSEVQRLSRQVYAVCRRQLLDEAKTELLAKESLLTDEDFLYIAQARRRAETVRSVWRKLSPSTQRTVGMDGLDMIIDSSDHSIRNVGNEAAHQKSEVDIGDAVLSRDLTVKQRKILRDLFMLVYNGREPRHSTGAA